MKVLFTLSMLVLVTATAAGSVGDALNVAVVGRNADGPSTSVALSAGLVFHGRGSVVEVLDRTTRVRLGHVEVPGVVLDIAYRDNLVFVAAGYAGLRIVSVSDPAQPVEVGHLDGLGFPYALALHGDLVLMVYAGDGLAVIDAADPAAPQLLATAPIDGLAIDVAVYGDRAIVARGPEGLEFFDISNPAQPVSVLVEPTVGSATSLQVAGDLSSALNPTPASRRTTSPYPASSTSPRWRSLPPRCRSPSRGTSCWPPTGTAASIWST